MMNIHVTNHAIERYIERIEAVTPAMAVAALRGPGVIAAASFGARVVRIPRGRIILKFDAAGVFVITVVEIDRIPFQLIPHAAGGPPRFASDPYWPHSPETLAERETRLQRTRGAWQ